MGFFDGIKDVVGKVSDFIGSPLGQFVGDIGGQLLGNAFNSKNTAAVNQANADLQREFAQNSIQWRVQDAKKAGIHPLYALGASTISASPSFVGAPSQLDFRSAFNAVADAKFNKIIQDQTILKNDLELKSLALKNQAIEKELVSGSGQVVNSRGGSSVSYGSTNGNNTGSISFNKISDMKKANDRQLNIIPFNDKLAFSLEPYLHEQYGGHVWDLNPTGEYGNFLGDNEIEMFRFEAESQDERIAKARADEATRKFRNAGIIPQSQKIIHYYDLAAFPLPKYKFTAVDEDSWNRAYGDKKPPISSRNSDSFKDPRTNYWR